MGKIVGITLVLGGIVGALYQWMELQKERQKRLEEFLVFLHKSMFAMETEKIKVIDYFAKYTSQDAEITKALHEIAVRLSQNVFPNGQLVWEEVLKEMKQNWNLSQEVFEVVVKSGMGFFGRSREENICFLKKQIKELENEQQKIKEKDAKERKVWVPVSMLSGVMLTILFL